jgi:hypothetical protein
MWASNLLWKPVPVPLSGPRTAHLGPALSTAHPRRPSQHATAKATVHRPLYAVANPKASQGNVEQGWAELSCVITDGTRAPPGLGLSGSSGETMVSSVVPL